MSTEPQIKFSNEESKANIRYKIAQNTLNIIDLTKSTIKSSESNELFKNSFKKFIQNEQLIESTGDKLQKIHIIGSQLNFQKFPRRSIPSSTKMSKYRSAGFIGALALGALIRLCLINNQSLRQWLQNRVEISTPLTSWHRVLEGIYLKNSLNSSSYEGDLVHEIPMMINLYHFLIQLLSAKHIIYFFILIDCLNSVLVYTISYKIIQHTCIMENFNKTNGKYARLFESKEKREDFLLSEKNFRPLFWSLLAMACYLFNPLNLACCMSQTTVLIHHFILLLWLNFLLNGKVFMSYFFLAIHANITVYSLVLIVPSIGVIRQKKILKRKHIKSELNLASKHLATFVLLAALVFMFNFYLENFNTRFIDCTYFFILKVRDLVPNMGLFWYFLTEMFDHFITFFIYVFQLNAFLYSVPLTLRLRDEPMVNLLVQIGLLYVFKSYPNIGETGLYTAFLPCVAYLFPLMRNVLVYTCMLIAGGVLAPIMFYLWLGSGGGNANFYFAITLVYSVGQIFLLVDVFYACLKREFIKLNGSDVPLGTDGKPASFTLE
ncbi:phosphatidylinositol glycan anchor biosynthesis class U [Brachionus plicatilis]|uniref:BLOC-1-related complex subunit 7 n=1 Tax=Brachionus plicatilis TaxID=10195 RepID=A0A3M7RBU6_BRAPC|nr:phosphatidylinositol glycan anchor biosynthesis class U [Brachionus plicatilis]